MNCVKHPDKEAAGVCTYCGKFHCVDCLVEIKGRMYCKDDVSKVFEEKSEQTKASPLPQNIVINNSSSSSASAYASAGGRYRRMHWIYFLLIGWWLGCGLICLIIPIFIPRLISRAFGYW
jgi:hypothetical protein